jgi:glycine cleavage system H protein
MPEKEIRTKSDGFKIPKISRRQFLQRLGITTGSAFVATLSMISACKSTESTTGTKTNTNTNMTGTTATTTSAIPTTNTTTTSNTPTTNPTTTSSIPITTTTTSNTGTQTTAAFSYTVPPDPPPQVPVPDTSCTVATDRLYSVDHVWVKQVSADVVVLGITSIMVKLLGEPHEMTLPDVGLKLAKDDVFTSIEGYKLYADIFTPVSGVIIQVNPELQYWLRGGNIQPIEYNPYTYGWIMAVRLSNPNELKDLLDSKAYLARLKG